MIERRVDFLGIPLLNTKIIPGQTELLKKRRIGMGVKQHHMVQVLSNDELYYTYINVARDYEAEEGDPFLIVRKRTFETGVLITGEEIKEYKIRGRKWYGKGVKYRWKSTEFAY